MIRCYITNRSQLPRGESVAGVLARRSDVDWVQIREKDLCARDLLELTRAAMALHPHVLVNGRVEVALAAGAAGVHLPGDSPSPQVWRSIVPAGFQIGVSCHSVDEVRRAEQEGADYVLFAPVFAPLSKVSALAPHGLDVLAHAAASVRIPVLALGGVTCQNAAQCLEAGAAGLAAITLFQADIA